MSFIKLLFPQVAFADSYGATECGAIASNGVPIKEKLVSVRLGPAMIGNEETEQTNRIGDEENGLHSSDGDLFEEGSVGELWVSSPSMSSGYYRDEYQTSKSFTRLEDPSGRGKLWYRTGDLVRVLDKGRWSDSSGGRLWLPRIEVLGRIGSAVRIRSTEPGGRPAIVSPDVLEGVYAVSPMLSQIFIHGQANSRALVAVVVKFAVASPPCSPAQIPTISACHTTVTEVSQFIAGEGVSSPDIRGSVLVSDEQEVLAEMIRVAASSGLLAVEVPLAVYLERKCPWTTQNNMLNASFKKRRAVFLSVYREALAALHAPYIV